MADNLQATPRNQLLGLLSDAMYGGINYMKDPRRSQQMQGLAGLLESTGIPKTTERMAYGEPLTNIGRANVPLLKPETAEAMMTVAPLAPVAGRLASRAVRATEGMPVGMSIKDVSKRYPQQAVIDLAQQRAALPVEQSGLGLPTTNTAADRAKAMGFETPALHGSGTPDINVFDPNLTGTKAGNAFDNYMWFTSNPESASGYALNTNQFASLPEVKTLNNQINQIGKNISSAYNNKNMDKVGDLRKELALVMKQKSDIYKDFEMGKYVSEGSTIYPVLLKTDQFMPYEAGGQNWMKANRPAIEESQSRGFQGVEIRNVKDNPNPSVGSLIANTYATENPDLIRSRFAAFDPFRKDVATATAMGVALPDLLAAEPTPEELQRRQSSGLLFP
jgi:hypothetical protein